jgi:hypothetical protein
MVDGVLLLPGFEYEVDANLDLEFTPSTNKAIFNCELMMSEKRIGAPRFRYFKWRFVRN